MSKKLGNAVVRNRIKRLIRSVLTELKPQLQSEIDFIVIARKPVVSMNYQELKKCMMHVLKLGKILIKDDYNGESRELSEEKA